MKERNDMKKLLLSIVAAALLFLPAGALADSGNYIVTIKDGETVSTSFEKKYNLTPLTTKDHGLYITDGENAEKIENNPKVEDVEETNYIHLSETPNDPYYTNGSQWGIGAVHADYGWSLSKGKTSTVVVIDTGFDFSHEDKGSNILPGKDFVAEKDPVTGQYKDTDHDYFTHGTGCAGMIGAMTGNGIGIAGLTDQCSVIVMSVFSKNAKGNAVAEDADVIAAIYSAVDDYHADVISMSFGGTSVNSAMEDAVRYAYDHNVILVAATGNSGDKGSPFEYPAAYEEVVGVANMNASYQINADSTKNESVYISAPGTNIITLSNEAYCKSKYSSMTGTSLATPFVSALAALAKAQDPTITPEEFKYYLRITSKDMNNAGYDIASGYGLIDYNAFLETLTKDNTKELSGDGTVQNPYILRNESDLRLFILAVSAGETTISALLDADITVSAEFTGITVEYNGTFDGGGHKISGLDESLFDTVGKTGTVQNLTLQGNIQNDMYSGLLATENKGTILNCHTEGSVNSETAAGICGISTGTIRSCSNRASVQGINAAGIAAVVNGGAVTQCYNRGDIRSDSNHAAGICCYLQNGAVLSSCYNTGNISGTNSTGGIVHTVYSASVTNCFYASGTVNNGTSDGKICAKSVDYMKTKGFVCMLNRGGNSFSDDIHHRNDGYPVLEESDLTAYFTDVPVTQWYANPVYNLAAEKILVGKGNHLYDPEATVTRAEFVTILAKTAGKDLSLQKAATPFSDVRTNAWYAAAVSWAYEEGLAKGKESNRFCPDDPVTREEISAFLTRFIRRYSDEELPAAKELTFFDTGRISLWAREDTAFLTALGVINGFPDNTFRPQNFATRGEAAQMVNVTRLHL